MQSEHKLSLPSLEAQQAEPLAHDRLIEAEKKLGFIPNMYKLMANSPGMFNTYVQGYSHFRESSKSELSPIVSRNPVGMNFSAR